MKTICRRKITVEQTRRISIRFEDESSRSFCPLCKRNEYFITAYEAAVIGGITEREMFKLIEDGDVHFQETERGEVFVCLTSLTADRKESYDEQ